VAAGDIASSVRARFERHRIALEPEQQSAMGSYLGLLTKWNRTLNLTALPLDPLSDEAVDRLLVEPVLAAQFLSSVPGSASSGLLIDVGSGSGSPAIPLKIAKPDVSLLMVESRSRKAAFLREAIRVVGLERAEVEAGRLEQLSLESRWRQAAHWVSVRAVRADSGLWRAISPLLAPTGRILWFRSRAEESQASATDYLPTFELEATEPLIAERRSELAVLRRPS
jgi:16S rRNA (guanine527-N7)-methyltransferase